MHSEDSVGEDLVGGLGPGEGLGVGVVLDAAMDRGLEDDR
jgi:hypothetical protein